jgi:hypothetical protein
MIFEVHPFFLLNRQKIHFFRDLTKKKGELRKSFLSKLVQTPCSEMMILTLFLNFGIDFEIGS